MKLLMISIIIFLAAFTLTTGFFIFFLKNETEIGAGPVFSPIITEVKTNGKKVEPVAIKEIEKPKPFSLGDPYDPEIGDEPQKLLAEPPEIVKAVYLTSASAGSKRKIDYLLDLASNTEINAAVIDIKDFSGFISYNTAVPSAGIYKTESGIIPNIKKLINQLHRQGIYVIARLEVFQDPVLAKARPDLAVHSKAKLASSTDLTKDTDSTNFATSTDYAASTLWLDNLKLAWIDPSAKEYWSYIANLAKDVANQGFDEINFDYARFPSDGDLKDLVYPVWDKKIPKHLVIKEFYQYLRQELPEAKLSVDLFGLTTVDFTDLGVGQIIEDAFPYFDFISPMTYPSLYASGFQGFENPNEYPYEVVNHSMANALTRLHIFKESNLANSTASASSTDSVASSSSPALRPWLQHFNLGVDYDEEKIKLEIQAVKDALGDDFKGFMFWSPTNVYIKEAFGNKIAE